MRFLHIIVGGQKFHKLQPSNCKGFKNTNLVISSTKIAVVKTTAIFVEID